MRFYHGFIESSGLWHLFDKGDAGVLVCGSLPFGENHKKIPIEKRELCWTCHSKVHDRENIEVGTIDESIE